MESPYRPRRRSNNYNSSLSRRPVLRRWVLMTAVVWLGVVFVTHFVFSKVGHRALIEALETRVLDHLHSNSNNADSNKAKDACKELHLSSLRVFCQEQFSSFQQWPAVLQAVEPHVRFHQAAIECALAVDIPACVRISLESVNNNSTNVTTSSIPMKPLPFRNQLGTVIIDEEDALHDFTEEDATRACNVLTNKVDQIFCEKHFIQLDDEETAKHYIHLYLDTELEQQKQDDNDNKQQQQKQHKLKIPPEEAQALCSAVPENLRNPCILHLRALPSPHVASHFTQIYNNNFNENDNNNNNNNNNNNSTTGTGLTKWDAEKLCHHIPTPAKSAQPAKVPLVLRQLSCVQQVLSAQLPNIAADRYIAFFSSTEKESTNSTSIYNDLTTLLGIHLKDDVNKEKQ